MMYHKAVKDVENLWGGLVAARREASPHIRELFSTMPDEIKYYLPPFGFIRRVDPWILASIPEMKAQLYGLSSQGPDRDRMLRDGAEYIAMGMGRHYQQVVDWIPWIFNNQPELIENLKTPQTGTLWEHLQIIGHNLLMDYGEDFHLQWTELDSRLAEMAES